MSSATENRTLEAVKLQTRAMGAAVYEIGLYDPDAVNAPMLPRTWDLETLLRSVPWLRYQNANGRNIYIRPKGEHSLSLVDDLTKEAVAKMKSAGFDPALVVETSPGNYQAWLQHGQALPKKLSTAVARALAEKFGGDPGAADWRHFGRLAGFVNRKLKHRREDGLFPFVRVVEEAGAVYPEAPGFVGGVKAWLDAKHEMVRRNGGEASRPTALKTIDDFRRKPVYAGDMNRVDLAYAVYALAHDVAEVDVRAALASRDLAKKGNEKRQSDYIERTLGKAVRAIGRQRGG